MIVQTTRFGKIEVEENSIITMPNGLLGFSGARLYTLLDDEIGSPFKWLQSLDNETLAFVTIDPKVVVSDYKIAISEEHLKKLHASSVEELSVMTIVTMTRDIKDVTVNLQGPLVVNHDKRFGMQLVIADGQFSTRHPLFGDKLHLDSETSEVTSTDDMRQAVAG